MKVPPPSGAADAPPSLFTAIRVEASGNEGTG